MTSGSAGVGAPEPLRRTAYLVMSHSRRAQVLRLIGTLRQLSPDAYILVHHDQRSTTLDSQEAVAAGADALISAEQPIRWGSISQVDVLLRALRWIADNVSCDWVVHLSGQDYPVRPLAEFEAQLRRGSGDAYLRLRRVGTEAEVAGRWREEAVRRYFYRYYDIPALVRPRAGRGLLGTARPPKPSGGTTGPRRPGPSAGPTRRPWLVAKAVPGSGRLRIGLRARHTPFTGDYACYKGSYWVTLSRRALGTLLAVHAARPELYEHFRRTSNPDEAFVPTLLANERSIALQHEEFRYLDWTQRTPHPDVLTVTDLDRVLASGRFLARKFDIERDVHVLDAIDERLGLAAAPER